MMDMISYDEGCYDLFKKDWICLRPLELQGAAHLQALNSKPR